MRRRSIESLAFGLLTSCLAGCSGDPVAGSWQGQLVEDQYNSMEALDDGDGSAVLHVPFVDGGKFIVGAFVFDLRWEMTKDDSVEFEMNCESSPFGDGSCEIEDDFDMRCKVGDDEQTLSCRGSDNWEDYALDWNRVGD